MVFWEDIYNLYIHSGLRLSVAYKYYGGKTWWSRDQQKFSLLSQTVNLLGSLDHMVSCNYWSLPLQSQETCKWLDSVPIKHLFIDTDIWISYKFLCAIKYYCSFDFLGIFIKAIPSLPIVQIACQPLIEMIRYRLGIDQIHR